ncbi:hypothetical protein ACP70R_040413 [Stipagrostis hirtigluma subsp. patula]
MTGEARCERVLAHRLIPVRPLGVPSAACIATPELYRESEKGAQHGEKNICVASINN